MLELEEIAIPEIVLSQITQGGECGRGTETEGFVGSFQNEGILEQPFDVVIAGSDCGFPDNNE